MGHTPTEYKANPQQTGGVALTLSVTYLSLLAHQRNREHQGALLRAQALQLHQVIDPLPVDLPPTRAELAAAQRATTLEAAKDRWNHEVERAVRWAQTTDWDDVRASVESKLEGLWSGSSAQPAAAVQAADNAARTIEGDAASASETSRAAYLEARRTARSVEQAAENKLLEARLRANRAGEGAAQAIEAGKEAAKDLAAKAKAAVLDNSGGSSDETLGPSPVQLALRQRFEKAPEPTEPKTVAQALQERYIPIDQRDDGHVILRGL